MAVGVVEVAGDNSRDDRNDSCSHSAEHVRVNRSQNKNCESIANGLSEQRLIC